MTGAPWISVIIVNWNGRAHLPACLAALASQTRRDFEVILVDNGSTDDSLAFVAEHRPDVRVLALGENTGFAAANNRGAAIARGRWLALLNNDAFPEPDWLERLAEAAERHPECSGFASLQLQHAAPTLLDGAGDAYHCLGVPWREGLGQPVGPPWDEGREIVAPCAAAAMYAREPFLALGGFDEAYFCYMEDVDLGLRMTLAGHRFRFVPTAVVRHVGSGTQGRASAFTRYHGHRNLVWTFLKNMPSSLLLRYLPGHLLMNMAAVVRFALRGEAGPILRAKRDALRALPRVLADRRRVQAQRTIDAATFDGRLAHGWRALWRESRARTP